MADARRRITIGSIMTLVLVVALVFSLPYYSEEPWLPYALFAALLGRRWVTVPISLRRSNRHPVEKDYLPFDPDGPDVPGPIGDRFRRATADLDSLGFGLRGIFRPDKHPPLAISHLGIYGNRRTLEAAKLVVIATRTRISATLFFIAKFADGSELATSDNANLRNWPPPPWQHGESFPTIRDASALYEVHRALLARHGAAPIGYLPDSDEDLPAHIREAAERVWARPLALGLYERDGAGQFYRPTWKGAFLIAWGRLWPAGAIRQALRRRRALRTLGDLGLADRAEIALPK